ncbi:MAG TPA: ABC transporter permease [Candidatus Saccharimonadales bacterium]|nr:ABC transporter permease [Candidatus Saccharimonadales bacterium]
MWSGNVKTAIANLRSSKWRSLLTMMGVIIGITSVVTIVSLGEGLKHQVVGQINNLGSDVLTVRSGKLVSRDAGGEISGLNVLAFLNSSNLTAKDVAALSSLSFVSDVTPIDFVTSSASSDSNAVNNAYVLGTSPTILDLLHQKIQYGEFFTKSDSGQKFAVIGSNVAHKLYGELNPTGHTITIAGQDYIIHGVLAPSSGGLLSVGETDFNSSVLINFDQAISLANGGTNILQILLKSKDSDTQATINQIYKTLLGSHQGQDDFTVLRQEELLSVVTGVVNNLTGFISGIAAISLLVGGIGIMDIMLVSVSERTREIGIRKAIGATNRQILNQFLVEGLALTLGGGLIGVIMSLLVFAFLRLYTNLHPIITVPIMLLAVFVSIAVGVIFSIAPALKAARKDPINALRGD